MNDLAGQYIKKQIKIQSKKVGVFFKSIPYNIRRAYNKKVIKSRDFTVISNNCWAGRLYQYLDMPYLSPTVGLYFFADDYIRFVKNLKYYMSLDLEFIKPEQSKYYEVLKIKNQLDKPIGALDDVEIVFLHYKTEEEAYEKWNRRKARINWDNLYIKFSKMNMCTESNLWEFDSLPVKKKFMLIPEKSKQYNCSLYWSGSVAEDGQIELDTIPFPGNLNLHKIMNIV